MEPTIRIVAGFVIVVIAGTAFVVGAIAAATLLVSVAVVRRLVR